MQGILLKFQGKTYTLAEFCSQKKKKVDSEKNSTSLNKDSTLWILAGLCLFRFKAQ